MGETGGRDRRATLAMVAVALIAVNAVVAWVDRPRNGPPHRGAPWVNDALENSFSISGDAGARHFSPVVLPSPTLYISRRSGGEWAARLHAFLKPSHEAARGALVLGLPRTASVDVAGARRPGIEVTTSERGSWHIDEGGERRPLHRRFLRIELDAAAARPTLEEMGRSPGPPAHLPVEVSIRWKPRHLLQKTGIGRRQLTVMYFGNDVNLLAEQVPPATQAAHLAQGLRTLAFVAVVQPGERLVDAMPEPRLRSFDSASWTASMSEHPQNFQLTLEAERLRYAVGLVDELSLMVAALLLSLACLPPRSLGRRESAGGPHLKPWLPHSSPTSKPRWRRRGSGPSRWP